MPIPQALTSKRWDVIVIVIGTGIGGATIGHALASAGGRILFLEKGRSQTVGYQDSIAGDYADKYFERGAAQLAETSRDVQWRAGRYWRGIWGSNSKCVQESGRSGGEICAAKGV
ncbi:MAG: hypothetical protein WCA32_07460 [Chromatiaceae bacterium]